MLRAQRRLRLPLAGWAAAWGPRLPGTAARRGRRRGRAGALLLLRRRRLLRLRGRVPGRLPAVGRVLLPAGAVRGWAAWGLGLLGGRCGLDRLHRDPLLLRLRVMLLRLVLLLTLPLLLLLNVPLRLLLLVLVLPLAGREAARAVPSSVVAVLPLPSPLLPAATAAALPAAALLLLVVLGRLLWLLLPRTGAAAVP